MLVVLDTNVIYAALRSSRGASFALLRRVVDGDFQMALSVALCLEYEDVAFREPLTLPERAINDILDQLVAVSVRPRMAFLWRPQLRDPKDDMVLELAINANCPYIVTFNIRDFRGSEAFGIQATTPAQFLALLGGPS